MARVRNLDLLLQVCKYDNHNCPEFQVLVLVFFAFLLNIYRVFSCSIINIYLIL